MDRFSLLPDAQHETVRFEWGQLHWYASGPLGNSDALTVGRCVLDPGQANPRHHHPNCEEALYVLSGRIEHFIDGEGWLPMAAGDTITVAPKVWHQARNVGSEAAHLLICFSSAERETIGE